MRAGNPDLRAEHVGTVAVLGTCRKHLLFDLMAGFGRHGARPRGPGSQAGFALGRVAVDPGLHALAGHTHRRGNMRLLPASPVALNDQSTTVNGQSGTTVGHENLRVGVGLRQATSHPEVLARSARLAVTNVLAGYI